MRNANYYNDTDRFDDLRVLVSAFLATGAAGATGAVEHTR